MSKAGFLLQTKLFRPPLRPFRVPRPHLVQKLNDRLWSDGRFHHPFTLISAPAGFGKTSLAVEWLIELPNALPVQSAVYGFLNRLCDLGVTLISLHLAESYKVNPAFKLNMWAKGH